MSVVKNKPVKLVKPETEEESAATLDSGPEAAITTKETDEKVSKVKIKAKPELVEQSGASLEEVDQILFTANEIENLKEEKAFKLVPSLLDDIDRNAFRLGGILARIQSQGWFMDRGHENLKAYVENETDIGYRKAVYLIGIYNALVSSGVKWAQVKHLGWTKLKDLAPHLTKDNVEEWCQMVDGLTTLQIQALIKQKTAATVKTGDSGSAEEVQAQAKVVTMTFKLHEDQKVTVREALDKAKHETGTEHDSVALENIMLDYLGGESKIKLPSLKELMASKSAEEVLELFGEVFPDVELSATLP